MPAVPSGALRPFHLAFPVTNLADARAFYGGLLGCPEGRSSDRWVDFDFFGHQLVAHLSPDEAAPSAANPVDGDDVPVRHFGVVLSMDEWHTLADRLKAAGTRFVIEPRLERRAPGSRACRASTSAPCPPC